MRINELNHASSSARNSLAGDERISELDTQKVFKRELTLMSGQKHKEYISSLIDEITQQGKKISVKADVSEIQKYRELVGKLLKENVDNSFSYHKNEKWDARGRHKVFALIKNVNKKLDDLTAEVLKNESDNIAIAGMVDDIRGMLVDLFL